ncbi:MAG: hypothetical protein L0Z50_32500, partial [Verrucomicrobiales bacterium]|nr:hypothetical protein [Verrucomicrobiales bacterium]
SSRHHVGTVTAIMGSWPPMPRCVRRSPPAQASRWRDPRRRRAGLPQRPSKRVSSPRKGTYHEVEAALAHALREVQHRIKNGVRLY